METPASRATSVIVGALAAVRLLMVSISVSVFSKIAQEVEIPFAGIEGGVFSVDAAAGCGYTIRPRTTCSGSRPFARSLVISWYASTKRIVPDAERSTIEWVKA